MATDSVFAGLEVLDTASLIAGPAAATMLSDFGAEVIKIEPPGAGDTQRILGSIPPNPHADANYSWHMANRNKRGMATRSWAHAWRPGSAPERRSRPHEIAGSRVADPMITGSSQASERLVADRSRRG